MSRSFKKLHFSKIRPEVHVLNAVDQFFTNFYILSFSILGTISTTVMINAKEKLRVGLSVCVRVCSVSDGIHPPACGLSLWQRKDGALSVKEPGQSQCQDKGTESCVYSMCQKCLFAFAGDVKSRVVCCSEWIHTSSSGGSAGPHTHHQSTAAERSFTQWADSGECVCDVTMTHWKSFSQKHFNTLDKSPCQNIKYSVSSVAGIWHLGIIL